jgi:hypothetical protein
VKNRHRLGIAVFFVALAACGGGHDAPALPEDAVDGLPPLPPAGWSIVEGPTPYDADSLFEYLNGGAPLYLKFGFQGLTQTRYQLGDDPFASVVLDIYEMDSDLGAFGVYRSILPPEADVEDWGVEGYRSGTVASAWRGSIYVHGEADDTRPELVDVLEMLVSSTVEDVDGLKALPADLDVLPRGGLIRGSERYVAADLFGHAFLPGGIVAGYEVDGGQVELFFTQLPDLSQAADAMELLRAHLQEWGEIEADTPDFGYGGFRFTDPGLGSGVVVRSGKFIAGGHGSASVDTCVRQLLELLPQD